MNNSFVYKQFLWVGETKRNVNKVVHEDATG